jgi:WD repeat-containing protein 42A
MAAHKLALLHDSPHVFYSCGEDGVVFQIDLRQERPNKCYTTKENDRRIALYSIHSNPLNSYEHCVGGRDQYIRIYDARKFSETDDNGGLLKKFCPHNLLTSDFKAHVTCAVYNYNGTEIIGSYNDDDIYLFDNSHSDGAEYKHKYTGHRNNATVKGVNFYGPHSEFVVSGSDCGNVFIWHCETEKIVNYFAADVGGVVNVLEPHPSLPLLATSGLDNDVKFWLPVAQEPATLDNLSKVVKKNQKDRENERNEPDVIDSQMLWFLMHTLRRNAARRAAAGSLTGGSLFVGLGDSDHSPDSDAESDDDASGGHDIDSDDDNGDRSRCVTS